MVLSRQGFIMKTDDDDRQIVRQDRNTSVCASTSWPAGEDDCANDFTSYSDQLLDEKIQSFRKLIQTFRMPDGNLKLKEHLRLLEQEQELRSTRIQPGKVLQVFDNYVFNRDHLVLRTLPCSFSGGRKSDVRLSNSSIQQTMSALDEDCEMIDSERNCQVVQDLDSPSKQKTDKINHELRNARSQNCVSSEQTERQAEKLPSFGACKLCHARQNNSPPSGRSTMSGEQEVEIICANCSGKFISPPADDVTSVNCKTQKEPTYSLRSSKRSSARKRVHHGVGDSPDTALELSDDEEYCRGEPSSSIGSPMEKSSTSNLKRRAAHRADRVLYPSSDDPEAVEVRYSDLQHLNPSEFLNDIVIDFYIKYIQVSKLEEEAIDLHEYCHFFSCFFYKKLMSGKKEKSNDYLKRLHKWTKGVNIFEKTYLIIPIHESAHWSLAIICFPMDGKVPYIYHLDSMSQAAGHSSDPIYKMLRSYLEAERKHLQQQSQYITDFEPLKSVGKRAQVPLQDNESDCGLFVLHYIEKFVEEAPAKIVPSILEKMFTRNWFQPNEASELRGTIYQLLDSIFEQRSPRISCSD